MTREEAITLIKNDMKLHHDYLSGTYRKALNMAIEALSVEVVRCKDCKHKSVCSKSVKHTIEEPNTITILSKGVDYCSCGKRREDETN